MPAAKTRKRSTTRRTKRSTRTKSVRSAATMASHKVNVANWERAHYGRGLPHDSATFRRLDRNVDVAEKRYARARSERAKATGRKDKVGAKRARRAVGRTARMQRDAMAASRFGRKHFGGSARRR